MPSPAPSTKRWKTKGKPIPNKQCPFSGRPEIKIHKMILSTENNGNGRGVFLSSTAKPHPTHISNNPNMTLSSQFYAKPCPFPSRKFSQSCLTLPHPNGETNHRKSLPSHDLQRNIARKHHVQNHTPEYFSPSGPQSSTPSRPPARTARIF